MARTKTTPPTGDDLKVAAAARFLVLPKALSKAAVNRVFDAVVKATGAEKVIAREVRRGRSHDGKTATWSLLCFQINQPPRFLPNSELRERIFGFVLLIERRGYIAALHQHAKGLDREVDAIAVPVARERLMHLWAGQARYQRLGTRRMSMSTQELRRASYEAEDLETAFVPVSVSRSIVQSLSLDTRDHGRVSVTPVSGRTRVNAKRADLTGLFHFVDSVIDALEDGHESEFLKGFALPIDVSQLPPEVTPTGVLVDMALLHQLILADAHSLEYDATVPDAEQLVEALSKVFELALDGADWIADLPSGDRISVRKNTASFTLRCGIAEHVKLVDAVGDPTPLDRWIRDNAAFSISFSSPDYFYAAGSLYKSAGFKREATALAAVLEVSPCLGDVTSEKGVTSPDSTRFGLGSIFRGVEDEIVPGTDYLICLDLGDEWADYVAVSGDAISLYHCKHGAETSGASALHVVVAQAIKNLNRVQLSADVLNAKFAAAEEDQFWADTQIPRLAHAPGTWSDLRKRTEALVAAPNTRWRVALVASALSLSRFVEDLHAQSPRPHFVQQVWLLSGFVTACRERGAEAVVYVAP